MNLKIHSQGVVEVTLSERNIRELLQAFESKSDEPALFRKIDNRVLYIRVESDNEHYLGRKPGPGIGWPAEDHIQKENKL